MSLTALACLIAVGAGSLGQRSDPELDHLLASTSGYRAFLSLADESCNSGMPTPRWDEIDRLIVRHPDRIIAAINAQHGSSELLLCQMGLSGNRAYLPFLVEQLGRGTVRMRAAAIFSLGQLGDQRHLTVVLQYADDSQPIIRQQALLSTIRLDPSQIRLFGDRLRSEPIEVCEYLAMMLLNEGIKKLRLAWIDKRTAHWLAQQMLENPDERGRRIAWWLDDSLGLKWISRT